MVDGALPETAGSAGNLVDQNRDAMSRGPRNRSGGPGVGGAKEGDARASGRPAQMHHPRIVGQKQGASGEDRGAFGQGEGPGQGDKARRVDPLFQSLSQGPVGLAGEEDDGQVGPRLQEVFQKPEEVGGGPGLGTAVEGPGVDGKDRSGAGADLLEPGPGRLFLLRSKRQTGGQKGRPRVHRPDQGFVVGRLVEPLLLPRRVGEALRQEEASPLRGESHPPGSQKKGVERAGKGAGKEKRQVESLPDAPGEKARGSAPGSQGKDPVHGRREAVDVGGGLRRPHRDRQIRADGLEPLEGPQGEDRIADPVESPDIDPADLRRLPHRGSAPAGFAAARRRSACRQASPGVRLTWQVMWAQNLRKSPQGEQGRGSRIT